MRFLKTFITTLALVLVFTVITGWSSEAQARDGLNGYWQIDRIEAIIGPGNFKVYDDEYLALIDKGKFYHRWQRPVGNGRYDVCVTTGEWNDPPAMLVPGERLDMQLSCLLQKVAGDRGAILRVFFDPLAVPFIDSAGRELVKVAPGRTKDRGIFSRQVPGFDQVKGELTLRVQTGCNGGPGMYGESLGIKYIYRPLRGVNPPSDRGTTKGMPVAGITHRIPWPGITPTPVVSPTVPPGLEQSQWRVSTYPGSASAGYWVFFPDGTMLGYTNQNTLKAKKPVWRGSYKSDAQGYLCRISINGKFYDFLVRMSQDRRSFEAFEKNKAGRYEKYRTGVRL